MKTVYVVVMLSSPEGSFRAPFGSREDAIKFITDWSNLTGERLGRGETPDGSMVLYNGTDPSGAINWSVLARHIIGMYIANTEPTSAERLADSSAKVAKAAEQMAEELKHQGRVGNEWKDD